MNGSLPDSIFFGDGVLRPFSACVKGANFKHETIVQNRERMTLSARALFRMKPAMVSVSRTSPAFLGRILCIFGVSAQKEMVRINASAYVASMANAQPLRESSKPDKIRNSVRAVALVVKAYFSVSPTEKASPNPALSKLGASNGSVLIDPTPKPLDLLVGEFDRKQIFGYRFIRLIHSWYMDLLSKAVRSSGRLLRVQDSRESQFMQLSFSLSGVNS